MISNLKFLERFQGLFLLVLHLQDEYKMNATGKGGFGDNPQNRRNGRPPKEQALTDVLRSKIDKDAVAEKLIEMAMVKGDISALKYVFDRVDGKPTETHRNENMNYEVTEVEIPVESKTTSGNGSTMGK